MNQAGFARRTTGNEPGEDLMSDLRYPIGTFEHQGSITPTDLEIWISQIEALPGQMREAVSGLSDAQLDTPYRHDGWTIRQVVHHVPDSHLNAYVRFKWALTEDKPVIRTYFEERWAELPDYRVVPVETSLEFLGLLHRKWVALLRELSREHLSRKYVHPESGPTELAYAVGSYAWHGRHHLAHISNAVTRHGWII
jgi:hypothetical protein